MQQKFVIHSDLITQRIFFVRAKKVIFDVDLAKIYGVTTKHFNQAVKRNRARFPEDFMFQLSADEFRVLRSQIVTANRGGRRTPPYAFTEHGAIMAASIITSDTAVRASVEVVRAFVKLREQMMGIKQIQEKILQMEAKYEGQFKLVFEALHEIMEPMNEVKPPIGFLR